MKLLDHGSIRSGASRLKLFPRVPATLQPGLTFVAASWHKATANPAEPHLEKPRQGQSVQLTIISDSSEKGVGRSLRLGWLTFGLAAAFGRALSQQKEITDASFSAKSASRAVDEDFDPIA